MEYFAWIYFHGWWNFNNPAWIFLRYCKMCNMEMLWKKQTFAILKQIFYGRCVSSIIRHYSQFLKRILLVLKSWTILFETETRIKNSSKKISCGFLFADGRLTKIFHGKITLARINLNVAKTSWFIMENRNRLKTRKRNTN